MDSAIPSHLRCPRSRHRRVPDDDVPPYPSFVARHAQRVERVVMAYFGVQSQAGDGAALEDAVKYLSTLGPAAGLKLYHEVTVARADEQFFEYLGCHPRTGLLRTG